MTNTPQRRSGGFTILELMVVITIIVLLVAILVPVVSKSRNAARAGATLVQMQHIAQACEHYYSDFGAYPGAAPDTALDGVVKFTGAQNLFLGLTRRFYPVAPTVAVTQAGTLNLWFDNDSSKQLANYAINNPFGPLTASNAAALGVPAYNTFDAYLTPKASEISGQKQMTEADQTNTPDLVNLPCFVDSAFGESARPILYYRQVYKYDAENSALGAAAVNGTPFAQAIVFNTAANGQATYYAKTNTLLDKDGTIPVAGTLDSFVTNTINGKAVPKGGFVLISAGIDRVYGTSDDIVVAGGH